MDDKNKYNNALEKLQEALSPKDGREISGLTRGCIESIFPELKESEDERIRKEIIEYIKTGTYHKDWIAWLEKQSKKSVNIDIESMVSSYKQRLESQGNGSMKNNPLVNMCLTAFKHGVEEVLQELNLKEFEKPQGESESERIRKAVKAIKEEKIDNANKYISDFKASDYYVSKVDGKIHSIHNFNEQKFKVGEWIVWQNKYCKVNYNGCGYELVDQNGLSTSLEYGTVDENAHIWDITKDAEDGDVLVSDNIIFIFNKIHDVWINCHCSTHKDGSFMEEDYDLMTIKYSKEVYPATKEQRDKLLNAMADAGWTFDFEKKELKKLKKVEQNPAWSEEDERLCLCLIEEQKEALNNVKNDKYGHSEIISDLKESCRERINWLKSLKDRVQPQLTWKPTGEQIGALRYFITSYLPRYNASTSGWIEFENLQSLYNDLKKIKEE
jgi:hypothetical protein